MCVILVATDTRPTEEMVERAFSSNNAGAGIAWRDGGFVHWEKGLELPRIKELCANTPLPYVAHFRIPSVGGKRDDLCHPFPISKDVPMALRGKTKGFVLFHNGHWHTWKDAVLTTVKFTGFKIPAGKWSDTRAMAWYAAHCGVGILEFIDERAVAFGPEKTEVFGNVGTGGWCQIEGVWASNRFFENRATSIHNYGRGTQTREEHTVHGSFYHGQAPASIYPGGPKKEVAALGPAPEDVEKGLKGDGKGTGGSSQEDPFLEASRLRAAGQLSNKKWKKALRKHEKWLRKEEERGLKAVVKH